MKKTINKIAMLFALISILVSLSSCTLTKDLTRKKFINEIGGVSETFIGEVSDTYYHSVESAVTDYVYKEIAFPYEVNIVSITSKGVVHKLEHKIPDVFLNGSVGVENVEVGFSVNDTVGNDNISLFMDGEIHTVSLYVIKYNNQKWRYFVSLPSDDEVITKSYYNSIFDEEFYNNSTYEREENKKYFNGGIVAEEYTLHQVIKIDGRNIYIEQTETTKDLFITKVETVYIYVDGDNSSDISCYVKEGDDGDWRVAKISEFGFYSTKDIKPFVYQSFSSKWFVKTDYGFKIPEVKSKTYFTNILFNKFNNMNLPITKDDIDEVDTYAEYFVHNGVLTGIRIDSIAKMKVESEGKMVNVKLDYSSIEKVTNYGTTVVEKPNVN